MEKADILEMTVRHLRQLQHQQFSGTKRNNLTSDLGVHDIPVAKGGSRGSDEPPFENQQALLNSAF